MKYGIKLASENSIYLANSVGQLRAFVEDRVLRNARAVRSTNDALAVCAEVNVLILFGIDEIKDWLKVNGTGQYYTNY
jgi:hypothetical protein